MTGQSLGLLKAKMRSAGLTFMVAMLLLSFPDRSYAMIELLSVFFAVGSAVLSIAGASLAAIPKVVILSTE